ncbi:hypothetical protein OLOG_00035 [Ostreococcus lucimarinus virus OlV4]|nr:hypothetical protein OLOG_00035 [Ostreococcus lucimarinus virus OlV4]
MSEKSKHIDVDKEIGALQRAIILAEGSLDVFTNLKKLGIQTIEIPPKSNTDVDTPPDEIVKKMQEVAQSMGAQVMTSRKDFPDSSNK